MSQRIDERITDRYGVLSPQEQPRRRDPARAPRRPRDVPLRRARRPRRGVEGDDEPTLPPASGSSTSTRSATTCARSARPASRAASTGRRRAATHVAHERESTPARPGAARRSTTSSACWHTPAGCWSSAGATATRSRCTCASSSPRPAATYASRRCPGRSSARSSPTWPPATSSSWSASGADRPASAASSPRPRRTGATVVLLGRPHGPPARRRTRRTGWSARSTAPSRSTATPPR